MLVLPCSLTPNGETDNTSLHGSCPTIKGEKWSATKWIHVGPFGGSAESARAKWWVSWHTLCILLRPLRFPMSACMAHTCFEVAQCLIQLTRLCALMWCFPQQLREVSDGLHIMLLRLLCRGECIDGDERCAGWAAEGECKKNPGYMLSSCRLSCHSCNPASKEEAAAAA